MFENKSEFDGSVSPSITIDALLMDLPYIPVGGSHVGSTCLFDYSERLRYRSNLDIARVDIQKPFSQGHTAELRRLIMALKSEGETCARLNDHIVVLCRNAEL